MQVRVVRGAKLPHCESHSGHKERRFPNPSALQGYLGYTVPAPMPQKWGCSGRDLEAARIVPFSAGTECLQVVGGGGVGLQELAQTMQDFDTKSPSSANIL
jgi:hypothetical protein